MSSLVLALLNLVVLAAVFVPLERVFSARPGQPILRPAFALDGCFFFGQYLLTSAASLATLGVASDLLRAHGASLRVASHWPAWASIVVAVMLGDLVVYWFHRACHRFDLLWRFHAVHHTSEHLDWLAAHREHPLDGITTQLCMNLPAMLLGVRMELLAGAAVLRGMWAIFVHSNARVPLGPLRWLLGAPELHHWHHARLPGGAPTHNFANLAPYLDVLFGTHHCPALDGEERYPLGLDERWEPSWLHMMLRPFWPSRFYSRTQTLPALQCAVLPPQGSAKHSLGALQLGSVSVDASARHTHDPLHSTENVRQSSSTSHFGVIVASSGASTGASLADVSEASTASPGEESLAVVSVAAESPLGVESTAAESPALESTATESPETRLSSTAESPGGEPSEASLPHARIEVAKRTRMGKEVRMGGA